MDTRNDTQRNHLRFSPPKRSGKTPEAKVAEACDKYLDLLDFYVLRTSAGMTKIEGRTIRIGRTGSHDRTCCAPNGRYVSIEIKSARGTPSPEQERQRAFILRRNGIVIVPHSLEELKSELRAAFGADVIERWEAAGKARQAELRTAKRSRP